MSSSLSDRTATPTAIFTDPILGTPLQVYIHKDVPQRPQLAHLLRVYGGALATSLSDVTLIIVDPAKESGQAAFRQHGAKKNKIVLAPRWIDACIQTQALQTFQVNWAGCKVTGAELAPPQPQPQLQPSEPPSRSHASYYPHLQQAEAGPSHQQAYFSVTPSHPTHVAQVQSSTSQHPHVAQQSPNLPPQLSPHVLAQPLSNATGHQYAQTGQTYTHVATSLNTDQRLHHASGLTAASHATHFPASDLNPHSQHPHPQAHPQTYTPFYPAQTASSQHPYVQWQPHVQQQQQLQQQQQQQHHFAHTQAQARNQASLPPSSAGASNLPQPPQVQDAQMQIRPPELQDLSQPPNLPPDPTFQNVNPSAPSGTHGYGQGDHHQTQQARSAPGPGPNGWQPQVQQGYEWPQHEPQQQQQEYEFYSAPPPGPQAFEYTAGPYDDAPGPSTLAEPAPSAHELSPPVSATPSTPGEAEPEPSRGRKRKRPTPVSAQPAPPAFAPPPPRRVPSRSPTPPTSIIPSPYGGHVFTSEDHRYLMRYIDYCSATSQVLSLKEVCDRVAKKAGHHSVASWKRYANKKGLAVGEYAVRAEEASSRSAILQPAPAIEGREEEEVSGTEGQSHIATPEPRNGEKGRAAELAKDPDNVASRPGQGVLAIAAARARVEREGPRERSPTPPRALFRSTTGKGVAFTDGDVVFLLRFLEYKKHKPGATASDKAEFWAELARRAPHHTKTSWTKFYRRHREALTGDAPPPAPPEKRLRYSAADDVLLAKFWAEPEKPAGASDAVYQGFARLHPHHPWKGWQEHARLHKKKIEELVERIKRGENVDSEGVEEDGQ